MPSRFLDELPAKLVPPAGVRRSARAASTSYAGSGYGGSRARSYQAPGRPRPDGRSGGRRPRIEPGTAVHFEVGDDADPRHLR